LTGIVHLFLQGTAWREKTAYSPTEKKTGLLVLQKKRIQISSLQANFKQQKKEAIDMAFLKECVKAVRPDIVYWMEKKGQW